MRICGIDIGIEHLAYCILERIDNTKNFRIIRWDCISLLNHIICGKPKKNGTLCDFLATSQYVDQNNDFHYSCKKHIIQNIEGNKITKNVHKCHLCNRFATYNYNHFTYCTQHYKCTYNKMKPKLYKQEHSKSLTPHKLCNRIWDKFVNAIPEFLTVNEFYVENQGRYGSRVTAAYIFNSLTNFVMLNKLNSTVQYIVALNKIKFSNEVNTYIKNKCNTTNNEVLLNKMIHLEKINGNNYTDYKIKDYKDRKLLAIYYTEYILHSQNLQQHINVFSNSDKKDDFCDAFIHAFNKL